MTQPAIPATDNDTREYRAGVGYALAAFFFWGVAPIYFKWVQSVPAVEVLAHRIIWAVVFLLALIAVQRRWQELIAAIRTPGTVPMLMVSASFITVNWGLFIYAIQQDDILQTSLGYYINPLVNVLFGMLFFGERLRRLQWLAVVLAAGGTLVLALGADSVPWIALTLAVCFAFYGVIRKKVAVAAFSGLLIETTLLLPIALGYLLWLGSQNNGAFGTGWSISLLLMLAGVVTTLPLLWFTSAAVRLPLSLLGFFQYIAPSVAFVLAVFVYDETFTMAHAATFTCIWLAIILFSVDSWIARKRALVWRDVEQRRT
ncbi:MAG TPA: EamA family transporter RarD [Gammaproteobacteria bacterium]|nr:EamA family transporter RarD [Gammaproteobacteria bacterium]